MNKLIIRTERYLLLPLLCLGLLLFLGWGSLALWYQLPIQPVLRWASILLLVACGLFFLAARLAKANRKLRHLSGAVFAIAAALLLGWWGSLQPSHDRIWADDVAELLEARLDGDRVHLKNVRNFEWRTETDYTPRWEERSYDLNGLAHADLVLSYWMGPHIAHSLVSFAFEDGERLVFSLEIRKERNESFSTLGGFFRQFERTLVAADERDILRTRSNARGEDVFLYRMQLQPDSLRALFLAYLENANDLLAEPRFYNTLTSNCTTVVFDLARQIKPGLPMDYRLLLSGHLAEYVYDLGGLVSGYSYAELQKRGYINPRALAADQLQLDYSSAIRAGVPGMTSTGVKP